MVQLEFRSIRQDIENRLARLHDALEGLYAQREAITQRVQGIEHELGVWQDALTLEVPHVEPAADGADERLVTMGLTDAVDLLRRERGMAKPAVMRHLRTIGYDFGRKRPGPAMHFAWLNSLRRRNGRSD